MDPYLLIKTIHILSSTILFGTGLGIAFFMVRSHFAENLQEKYYAARNTVLADFIFTFPAVIIQPLSGLWLILHGGYDWREGWLMLTYGIYILAGICWLPVVWLQLQMRNMLKEALTTNTPLPKRYRRYFRTWFILGWPAFLGLVVVFGLMVFKPALS